MAASAFWSTDCWAAASWLGAGGSFLGGGLYSRRDIEYLKFFGEPPTSSTLRSSMSTSLTSATPEISDENGTGLPDLNLALSFSRASLASSP